MVSSTGVVLNVVAGNVDAGATAVKRSAPGELTARVWILEMPATAAARCCNLLVAALVTGLNSDLPGRLTAQVRSNVYDSVTGEYLLIPQGARLIGEYSSRITYG